MRPMGHVNYKIKVISFASLGKTTWEWSRSKQTRVVCLQLAGWKAKMEVGVGNSGGGSEAKKKNRSAQSEMQVLEFAQEAYIEFGGITSRFKPKKVFCKG